MRPCRPRAEASEPSSSFASRSSPDSPLLVARELERGRERRERVLHVVDEHRRQPRAVAVGELAPALLEGERLELALQVPVEARGADGERELVRDAPEEDELVRRERARLVPRHPEDADRLALAVDRDAERSSSRRAPRGRDASGSVWQLRRGPRRRRGPWTSRARGTARSRAAAARTRRATIRTSPGRQSMKTVQDTPSSFRNQISTEFAAKRVPRSEVGRAEDLVEVERVARGERDGGEDLVAFRLDAEALLERVLLALRPPPVQAGAGARGASRGAARRRARGRPRTTRAGCGARAGP